MGFFGIHVVVKIFNGSAWINDGHDGVKELLSLEMDDHVLSRDYGKVNISCCLDTSLEVVHKVWRVDGKDIYRRSSFST